MQCKELEAVLESEDLTDLSSEAREHLARCPGCQNIVADLTAIVVAAKHIPAEVAPPDRIWLSIRTQLQAEGIIEEAEPVVARAAWLSWENFAEFFRPRVLATVAAGLLVVVGSAYVLEHRAANTVQAPQPSAQAVAPVISETAKTIAPPPATTVATTTTPSQQAQSARSTALAQPRPSTAVLRPSPSEDAYFGDSAAVLSQTEDAVPRRRLANNPAVDSALRQNLRTLDDFIAECQSRLKQNPQDVLSREYLNMAYQQKAELLNAMMDSGRSEQ